MARLWEVLKAFDEGTAIKAVRKTDDPREIIELKKVDGKTFKTIGHDKQNLAFQGFYDGDFTKEWDIVALRHHEFRHLFVVIRITDDEEDIFWRSHVKENMSLSEFLEWFQSDEDDCVEVMTAVGVSENSEATIIVQEGTYLG